jgi:hypothetical protein
MNYGKILSMFGCCFGVRVGVLVLVHYLGDDDLVKFA